MDYKKQIRSKKLRLKILKKLSFISDEIMIKLQYRISTGYKLNIKNPQTFNEKIQLYKLKYRNKLMIICADKFAVRKYIEGKGYSEILNVLYGVFNSYSEINFKDLPKRFVLKTTNGSGTNYICLDKNEIDHKNLKKIFKEWMKPFKKSPGREWAYDSISPKIVCEKYLDGVNGESLMDYKIFCFDGKPYYIQVDIDREENHKRNIYDTEWNYIDETITYENKGDVIKKPNNLDDMLKIASELSKDFPHVRVDLYNQNNNIVFGELTFYHGSGYEKFSTNEFAKEMGSKFDFPKTK